MLGVRFEMSATAGELTNTSILGNMAPGMPLERDQAVGLGFRITQNMSRCFDALQVSIRGSIPASALSSEDLAVSVSSLYDGYFVAWKEAVGAVAYSRSKDSYEPPSSAKVVASEEEAKLDAELTSLRARRRNAVVATSEIAARRREVGAGVEAINRIASALKSRALGGSDENDGSELSNNAAQQIVEDLGGVDRAMECIRLLLENEGGSCPLLERVSKEVDSERIFSRNNESADQPFGKFANIDAESQVQVVDVHVDDLANLTERLQGGMKE